jgi:dienelactone hydrolase
MQRILVVIAAVLTAMLGVAATSPAKTQPAKPATAPAPEDPAWKRIEPFFHPPAEYGDSVSSNRDPLTFDDGKTVKSKQDWEKRRKEILDDWNNAMGQWPELLVAPKIETIKSEHRETFTQHTVTVEIDSKRTQAGYLLVPDGKGPFPAVLVVYYDPETSVGLSKTNLRDFGLQLARRGFVTLSIGAPAGDARNPQTPKEFWQPLSYLAYVAANCHTALAASRDVDPAKIGIVGHSFGGKWAMMASCLYDKFAAAVWCDPGLVFDDKAPNANYWEAWYLGMDSGKKRKPGPITAVNPTTGAYKALIEANHDLTEIHALMAPRPFLVSGGAEDPLTRWPVLNHAIAVNKLLGYSERVGLTSRSGHTPTIQSNDQVCDFFEHFLKNTDPAKEKPGLGSQKPETSSPKKAVPAH